MPSKRVTIDLNEQSAAELERLKSITGLKTCDVFRYAVTLLRIYCTTQGEKKEVRIVDPTNETVQSRIEFPFFVIPENS
jgi:hypothetical protein